MHQQIPAGWYPESPDSPTLRWWSGSAWTEHTTTHEEQMRQAAEVAEPKHRDEAASEAAEADTYYHPVESAGRHVAEPLGAEDDFADSARETPKVADAKHRAEPTEARSYKKLIIIAGGALVLIIGAIVAFTILGSGDNTPSPYPSTSQEPNTDPAETNEPTEEPTGEPTSPPIEEPTVEPIAPLTDQEIEFINATNKALGSKGLSPIPTSTSITIARDACDALNNKMTAEQFDDVFDEFFADAQTGTQKGYIFGAAVKEFCGEHSGTVASYLENYTAPNSN